VVRGPTHPIDFDRADTRQAAGATQQVDAVVGEPALLAGVGVVGDHEVTPRERAINVDRGRRRGLARGVHRFARAQQRLGRNTGPIGALASHQIPFDECDPQTACRQRSGAMLAGRAAAEDDHVVVTARAHRYLRHLLVHGPLAARRGRRAARPTSAWRSARVVAPVEALVDALV
jgi:hypothetical protein